MLVAEKVNWDRVAEVIVVGYGLAGAVAAITAHDRGAEVLILEKQTSDSHHTNSSLSGGDFISASSVEDAIKYLEGFYRMGGDHYLSNGDIIRAWAEYTCQNKEWIEKLGCRVRPATYSSVAEYPDAPGLCSIQRYMFPGMGYGMMDFMKGQIKTRGIEIMYSTAAEKLLTDVRGEVVGTRASAQGDSKKADIGASRSVILTCGGFEYDEQMKANYLGVYPTYWLGSPANTGDGIRMALDVGADLWHMNCCSAGMLLKIPDCPSGFLPDLGGKGWLIRKMRGAKEREPAGYIVVDRQGQRFLNENFIAIKLHCLYYELTVFDSQRLEFPRVPSYWVFDQSRMEAGPLALPPTARSSQQFYEWSRDNSRELEKGWVVTAKTIGELALKLNIQANALEKTVEAYNLCCERGTDPDFGRGVQDLVPLRRPPFCAAILWPGGPNTQGGPKRNHRAQVLNTEGNPIPRLYSAGEVGSIYGRIYPGGGNLAECIAFGRIAGENAAKEPPNVTLDNQIGM